MEGKTTREQFIKEEGKGPGGVECLEEWLLVEEQGSKKLLNFCKNIIYVNIQQRVIVECAKQREIYLQS